MDTGQNEKNEIEERKETVLPQKNKSNKNSRKKKRKRKKTGYYLFVILGSVVILALIFYLAMTFYMWITNNKNSVNTIEKDNAEVQEVLAQPSLGENLEEKIYTQEDLDRKVQEAVEQAKEDAKAEEAQRILTKISEDLSNGISVVEALRPHYPENIVVVSNGKFHFVPIHEEWKKNSLIQENLKVVEGSNQLEYLQDGQVISHKGIDVSQHQGEINWQQVAADGVEFAFIRVGFRGYGTGKLVADEQFENNVKGALENGIKVGVYFFSQAITQEEVQEEAAFVLQKIAPYRIEFPVVFDVEKVASSSGRMNKISVEERTSLTVNFCQTIEAAGYTPMIYHNMEMAAVLLDFALLENYQKWFAYYGTKLYYPYDYQVWQYSEKGTVAGINGPVDLNISFQMWGE